MVIFSTQSRCVERRETSFEIPDEMPMCSGKHCICAWFWLPHTGQGNFYMTGFQCSISRDKAKSQAALQIAQPQPPRNCINDESLCVKGPKNPIFYYNEPSNVQWDHNLNRPAYNANWSFDIDGAQTDIFFSEDEHPREVSSTLSVSSTVTEIQKQHLKRPASTLIPSEATKTAVRTTSTTMSSSETRQLSATAFKTASLDSPSRSPSVKSSSSSIFPSVPAAQHTNVASDTSIEDIVENVNALLAQFNRSFHEDRKNRSWSSRRKHHHFQM
ncbi:hypothetical protein OIO90_001692 [Microbotryomycetes sp. JL221]|nr:hypothetical protein OIO90_001692 [Microbotryomycetes sp. JL221]